MPTVGEHINEHMDMCVHPKEYYSAIKRRCQVMKRHWGKWNAYLKSLHPAWPHLDDTLKKAKLWRRWKIRGWRAVLNRKRAPRIVRTVKNSEAPRWWTPVITRLSEPPTRTTPRTESEPWCKPQTVDDYDTRFTCELKTALKIKKKKSLKIVKENLNKNHKMKKNVISETKIHWMSLTAIWN